MTQPEICFYFSRYAPDRSPTDPYFGLPRFLSQHFRLVAFWEKTSRQIAFADKCEEVIDTRRSVWQFPWMMFRVITSALRIRPAIVICCIDESSLALGWMVSMLVGCRLYVVIEDPPFTSRYSVSASMLRNIEKSIRTFFIRRALSSCKAVIAFIDPLAFAEFITDRTQILNLKIGVSDEAQLTLETLSRSNASSKPDGIFRIGYVGAIDTEQGLPELLDAVAIVSQHIPQIHLDLIGDVEDGLDLTQQITRRGLESKVTVTGWISYGEMLKHLSRCDVGCYTRRQTRWAEAAYPLKICEYLGLAVPVVSWNYPGCRTMLAEGKYGVLVPAGDIEELAASLLLLADPPVRGSYQSAILNDQDHLRADAVYEQILCQVQSLSSLTAKKITIEQVP